MKEKLIAVLKNGKKEQWLVCGLAGLLLLVIAMPVQKKDKKEADTDAASVTETVQQTVVSESRIEYEKQLEEVLSQVQGVGNVKVTVTMESTGRKIVEKDSPENTQSSTQKDKEGAEAVSQSSSIQETTVYEETENGEIPYIISETYPEIRGVLIVAEGGDNPVVVQQIQEAVMALFHVEAHKIKVLKMK